MFYANLQLDLPTSEKEERVDKLIEALALTQCKDTIVGNELTRGISGGEMKRISIGISMITNPRKFLAVV